MAKLKKMEEKKNALILVKEQEKSLVLVEKKKSDLTIIEKREIAKRILKKVSLALIGTISILYIIVMAIVATSVFYIAHLQNGLIQKGVSINGISVSNLSSEEAINSVTTQLNEEIPESLILKYKENTYTLNLAELGIQFDVESAVNEAYNIGRTQNVVRDLWDYAKVMNETVNIQANLTYNEAFLDNWLEQLSEQLPDKVQHYHYQVEDDKLLIYRGKSGVELNREELKNQILTNLTMGNYEQEIEIPTQEVLPQEIDLQSIHDAIYTQSQNAYYTENPIEIHEQVVGVDFDVQEVQNQINSEPTAESYTIALTFMNPAIFVKDLNVFPDQLSTFCTNYANNANRTTNLRIASNKINGTVLMPGETFSFNQVVGERTIAAGYKNAAIFVNGQVEDGLAGGICQVSSTLYNAVVGANLEIKERHNHSKLTSYLPGGKDATVAWGRYDFQFKNNREYPIKIEMSVQNGVIMANIYGIKSAEEYEINIDSQFIGNQGKYSIYQSYKVYHLNGEEVKREFLARDLYQ